MRWGLWSFFFFFYLVTAKKLVAPVFINIPTHRYNNNNNNNTFIEKRGYKVTNATDTVFKGVDCNLSKSYKKLQGYKTGYNRINQIKKGRYRSNTL